LIEREPSSIRALIQSVGAFGRHAKRTDLPLMERCPVVLSGVRMPRMHSIMQRWIAARCYELLGRPVPVQIREIECDGVSWTCFSADTWRAPWRNGP
jgi:hypothetical protein